MDELELKETSMEVDEIKPKKKKKKKKYRETNTLIDCLTIIRNGLICFIIYSFVAIYIVSPIHIDGNSMYPTYTSGSFGISNAVSRYFGDIKRFDVVIIYSEIEEKYIIKRVIGLPNETIQVVDNKLYIDSIRYDEEYLDEDYMIEQSMKINDSFTADFGPVKLGDDEYFVMGDNRPISKDSRSFGAISKSEIRSIGFKLLLEGKRD